MRVLHLTPWWPTAGEPTAGSFIEADLQAEDDARVWRLPRPSSWTGVVGSLLAPLRLSALDRVGAEQVAQHRPELIHAHVTWPCGVIGARWARAWRLPLVVTEYWLPFSRFPWTTGPIVQALRSAQAVTMHGRQLSQRLERFCGRDVTMVRPVVNPCFKPPRILPMKGRLLCVGSLTTRKRFEAAIAALTYLPTHHLVIVGEGPERAWLKAQALAHGVAGRVMWRDFCSQLELAVWMGSAEALLVPSIVEGFSLVAAEALSCGTPALVTRCGGPEEYVPPEWILEHDYTHPDLAQEISRKVLELKGRRAHGFLGRWSSERRRSSIGAVYDGAYRQMPIPLEAQGAA